jgi:hypothetical protein
MSQAVQVPADEICQYSKQLATGLILGTIALLRDRQQSPVEWFSSIRQQFAANWEPLRGAVAFAMLRAIAINSTAIGAMVETLAGDTSAAELVITDWPPALFLDILGLTLEDVDSFWDALRPMMQHLNYSYEWQRDDVRVRLRVRQGEDRS